MSQPEPDAARFIARMTAGTTHEFRNVLAIVGESAGLIQDLMLAQGTPGGQGRESMLRAVQRIEKQVVRGAELVSALNGLAHALDQECEGLDLADQTRAAAVLCRHWTNQQDRRITVAPSVGVRVCASRLRLCELLTSAIECAAHAAPAGGEVMAAAVLRCDQPALWLRCAAPEAAVSPLDTAPRWSQLGKAAKAVGSSVEVVAAGREFVVLFSVSPERA
jgi:hypothetical protein